MAIISFSKKAGESLFRAVESQAQLPFESSAIEQRQQYERQAEKAILDHIASMPVDNLAVQFDSASATVLLTGKVPDQQTRERIILFAGNIEGVEYVDDLMEVAEWGLHSDWYTVGPGDTLPEIAQKFYRDAQKYWDIFEANQPLMVHPDKLYVGQTLRVPPATRKCYEPTILFRKNRHRPAQEEDSSKQKINPNVES